MHLSITRWTQLTKEEEERGHKGKTQGKPPTPSGSLCNIDNQIDNLNTAGGQTCLAKLHSLHQLLFKVKSICEFSSLRNVIAFIQYPELADSKPAEPLTNENASLASLKSLDSLTHSLGKLQGSLVLRG